MRLLTKLASIIVVIYLTLTLLLRKNYIGGSSEYEDWLLKLPDEVYEMRLVKVDYEFYTGEVLVVYIDNLGERYCWGTGIFDVNAYSHVEQLTQEKYVVARKDGKRIGIFQIR